jgi:hypothetical protein
MLIRIWLILTVPTDVELLFLVCPYVVFSWKAQALIEGTMKGDESVSRFGLRKRLMIGMKGAERRIWDRGV